MATEMKRRYSKSEKKLNTPIPDMSNFLTELTKELQYAATDMRTIGWRNIQPWDEFFGKFKAPRAWNREVLDERLTTNLLHFRGNYIAIVIAAFCLSIVTSPVLLLSVCIGLAIALFLFPPNESTRVVNVSGRTLSIMERQILCVVLSVIVTYTSGLLVRVLYPAAVSVLLCVAHAIFRPRNIKSKMNRLSEEAKQTAGANISNFLNSKEKRF